MENQLHFSLKLKPDLLEGNPSVSLEAWGLLIVSLTLPDGKLTLLELEWNLYPLAEWYVKYQASICSESLPVAVCAPKPNESLAQAWHRCFFEEPEGNDDNYEESEQDFQRRIELQEYATRHFLSTGLLGTIVPPIVIGCNRGVGEVSLCIKEGDYISEDPNDSMNPQEWSFTFSITDFCRNNRRSIHEFLTSWSTSHNDPLVRERTHKLTSQLYE